MGINMYGAEISNQENGKMFSYGHRDNMASVQYMNDIENDQSDSIKWQQDMYRNTRKYFSNRKYQNYPSLYYNESNYQLVQDMFGNSLQALQLLKTKYDPLGLFYNPIGVGNFSESSTAKTTSEPYPDKSGYSTWIWIVLAIVGVLILACVGFFYYKKK